MNENQNVDIDREQDNGQITYANEVISTIVSVATTEVDGISAIAGNSGLLGKGKLPRGVRAKTVYGNVGMVTFIVLTVLLTAISLFL